MSQDMEPPRLCARRSNVIVHDLCRKDEERVGDEEKILMHPPSASLTPHSSHRNDGIRSDAARDERRKKQKERKRQKKNSREYKRPVFPRRGEGEKQDLNTSPTHSIFWNTHARPSEPPLLLLAGCPWPPSFVLALPRHCGRSGIERPGREGQ